MFDFPSFSSGPAIILVVAIYPNDRKNSDGDECYVLSTMDKKSARYGLIGLRHSVRKNVEKFDKKLEKRDFNTMISIFAFIVIHFYRTERKKNE